MEKSSEFELASPVSYAIGTEVLVKDPSRRPSQVNLITAASTDCGCIQYAVAGCAWFTHEDLLFVAHATPQSLALAIEIEHEDDDYAGEEEDSDDPDE